MTITEIRMPTLRDLREQIAKAGPKHFAMFTYLDTDRISEEEWDELDAKKLPETILKERLRKIDFGRCGETGCIAGHAAVLLAHVPSFEFCSQCENDWTDQASEFFGLPDELVTIRWNLVQYKDRALSNVRDDYYLSALVAFDKANPEPEYEDDSYTEWITKRDALYNEAEYKAALDWLDWQIEVRGL